MAKFKYHPGDQFGYWTLIGYIGNGRWTAKCKCGKEQDCLIEHLSKGKSISCMTCAAERRKTARYHNKYEYNSWSKMRSRCLNRNDDRYYQYGGRGILICERWNIFNNFLADMGIRPKGTSLDRINVDGNYEPSNCRWATPKEQSRNLRIHKKKYCVTELADKTGIDYTVLRSRINRGWSISEATNIPIKYKEESICAKAREVGLNPGTVLCRVNRGWSIEKALSTPIIKRNYD